MTDINPTITTKFSFSESYPSQRIFTLPLFLLGSFLKEQALKEFNNDYTDIDKKIYFNNLKCELKDKNIDFEVQKRKTLQCKQKVCSARNETLHRKNNLIALRNVAF